MKSKRRGGTAPGDPQREETRQRGSRRSVIACLVALGLLAAMVNWTSQDDPLGEAPRDAWLRAQGVRFYAVRGPDIAPRAVVVFFGNDVGFWRPHRRLAADLAGSGYAVVGVDIVPLLAALPPAPLARDSVFRARAFRLIGRAYREVAVDARDSASARRSVPLVLLGHSLGAEVALRLGADASAGATTAASWPPGVPGIAGVVALSPGSRSHLRVAASDLLMIGEPTEPGSFAVSDEVAAIVAPMHDARVAIVRGEHDELRSADPALLAAGGVRARRFIVPWAGHSLARLTISRFVVRQAIAWVLEAASTGRVARLPLRS